ncbi:transmembrane protein 230-like [Olea europaea var. sylvestris]|uniref:transmembrane protein 230-like n=1 Tax=Olea europaea var. sylvestris TaxID=158386 RepID=UPI000C1D2A7C|nr:transmembrane protein 230-like [Olea europaea var. sylvestris]
MASSRNIHYTRLTADEDDNDDDSGEKQHGPRFDYTPKSFNKIPWKSIILAIFLLVLNVYFSCVLHLLTFFIFIGHIGGELSQAYGLLLLGIITLLPCFYETRIAYYSWGCTQGYRFTSILDYQGFVYFNQARLL